MVAGGRRTIPWVQRRSRHGTKRSTRPTRPTKKGCRPVRASGPSTGSSSSTKWRSTRPACADDPERMAVLDGGADDPDGVDGFDGRLLPRADEEGWDLDAGEDAGEDIVP